MMQSKTLKILCLLLLCSMGRLNAQIVFDWQTQKWYDERDTLEYISVTVGPRIIQTYNTEFSKRKIFPVEIGEMISLRIFDINQFLYKVEVSGENVEIRTNTPSEFELLFGLESDLESDDAEEGAELTENALEDMNDLQNSISTGDSATRAQSANLNQSLLRVISTCTAYYQDVETIIGHISNLKFKRNKLITYARQNISYVDMCKKVDSLWRIPLDTLRNDYNKFVRNYYLVETLYEEAEDAAVYRENKNKIKDAVEAIENGYEKIEEEHFLDLLAEVIRLEDELTNKSNFSVFAPPIQAEGDYISFQIKVQPSRISAEYPFETQGPIDWGMNVSIKKGVKISFSAGPIFSFGEGANDETYFFQATENPDTVSLQKGDISKDPKVTLTSLMHVYPRTGTGFSAGLLFGVGAGYQSADEEIDVAFLLGGSFLFGKREKAILNCGVSLLQVERLNEPQFSKDLLYNANQIANEDITRKHLKPSFFVGISYSFAPRND